MSSMSAAGRRGVVKILVLCVAWYASSSFNNLIGKQVLMQFEYPMTLTLVQLVSITAYSTPLLMITRRYGNVPPSRLSSSKNGATGIPTDIFRRVVIPLAIGKFIASVSSHISIWKVPVSYAHTVKATMPLFTVVLSRLIFNERHSTQTYLSLVPIILGVTIATLTEFNFDVIGLVSALMATLGFSLQNIFSKSVLKQTGIHQFELLQTLAKLSLILFLPFWVIFDLRHLTAVSHHDNNNPAKPPSSTNYEAILILLFLDGLLNFLQNILAFSVLKLVTPLTYSVANATKRIFIITVSLLFFGNRVSIANVLGIFIAVSGVLLYNKAKHDERRNTKILPTHSNNNYI